MINTQTEKQSELLNARVGLITSDRTRRNLKLLALHKGTTSQELGRVILEQGIQKIAESEGFELI